MKLLKTESPYLDKDQWRKVFLAMSIMTLILYITAMIFSLCGSKYFILNYQNEQMDRIEAWLRQYKIYSLITYLFSVIEFYILMSFILDRRARLIYPILFYSGAIIFAFLLPDYTMIFSYFYPLLFYLSIPIIEQVIENKRNVYKPKFSWKKYGTQMIKLVIAISIVFTLQFMIYEIKAGYFSVENHILPLSGFFVYSLEYDIALFVILYTISLYINREKGDSIWATYQVHGSSSQTTKKNSQKSSSIVKKNLTKTQRNKLRLFWIRFYLVQILGFLLLMVLPFLTGKVLEFLFMYFSFAVVRYILGFKYSLHFKKESLCIFVGAIVFGILTLAVPFFYVDMIVALVMGVGLAILLHLSYKYKGMWLFNQAAKPDKFALLYTFFDGDLDADRVGRICRLHNLDSKQCSLIVDFTQGEKISYLAWKYNYSQRMLIYKLDEAIDKLIK